MLWKPLADTLIQLVEAVQAPPDTGLTVTAATIDIPLEVQGIVSRGELVFYGIPPHTRWISGFLPEVHMTRLEIELMEETGSGW